MPETHETLETYFPPGTRVRIVGKPTAITLVCATGEVVGPDPEDYDDYCVVRLDTPAIYHGIGGGHEPLPQICVMYDNLRAMP